MSLEWNIASQNSANASDSIRVNVASRNDLFLDINLCLDQGDGFSIATLNLDHLVKIKDDGAFRKAYAAHSHVTADGNPIVWLQKVAGFPVSLIPGSELIKPIAEIAANKDLPVAFFGATQSSLEGAAQALKETNPTLNVVAKISPPMGFDPYSNEALELIDQVAASGARIVFLALGAPKQEELAVLMRDRHAHLGTISIGAGLDFLSGAQTRAPAWVRRLAMEWLWRLLEAPGRLWKRYWNCFLILPRLVGVALRTRLQTRGHMR